MILSFLTKQGLKLVLTKAELQDHTIAHAQS